MYTRLWKLVPCKLVGLDPGSMSLYLVKVTNQKHGVGKILISLLFREALGHV